jgi:hypothetical protein
VPHAKSGEILFGMEFLSLFRPEFCQPSMIDLAPRRAIMILSLDHVNDIVGANIWVYDHS